MKNNDQQMLKYQDFVLKLQAEATLQSRLSQTRLFPKSLDGLTTFIGHYPWQTVTMLSGFMALLLELL